MSIPKLKQGICDKCDGWIQFDKEGGYYYCMSCHHIWREEDWDYMMLVMEQEKEYHIPTEEENLSGLNNL